LGNTFDADVEAERIDRELHIVYQVGQFDSTEMQRALIFGASPIGHNQFL